MTRPFTASPRIPLLAGVTALALVGATGTNTAAAEAKSPHPSPRPWLEKKVERARKLAQRDVKPDSPAAEKLGNEIRGLIDSMIDWDEMIRRSLGSQWKKRTEDEQREFSKLLRQVIEASYESKLRMASKGKVDKPKRVRIEWKDEQVRGDKAKLTAKVETDDTDAYLEFSLLWGDGQWQVYDVAIDDVSTVITYRGQFRKIIAQEGFESLLNRMRKKLEDIDAGRADLAQ